MNNLCIGIQVRYMAVIVIGVEMQKISIMVAKTISVDGKPISYIINAISPKRLHLMFITQLTRGLLQQNISRC